MLHINKNLAKQNQIGNTNKILQPDSYACLIVWWWNISNKPKRLQFTNCCRNGLFIISQMLYKTQLLLQWRYETRTEHYSHNCK